MAHHDELLAKVEGVVAPLLLSMGFRLIEREFVSEHGRWILRLYMEKPAGHVTVDDCQRASRAVGDAIDVADIFKHSYSLEVSSPGIERPLRYPEDFRRFCGSTINVRTRFPVEGRSHFKGVLEHWEQGTIFIVVDGKRFQIPHVALAKARLVETLVGEVGKQH